MELKWSNPGKCSRIFLEIGSLFSYDFLKKMHNYKHECDVARVEEKDFWANFSQKTAKNGLF